MTQKQVDLQKLLEMEQARYKEAKKEQQQQQQQNPLFETIKSLEKELNLDIYSGDEENHQKKERNIALQRLKQEIF